MFFKEFSKELDKLKIPKSHLLSPIWQKSIYKERWVKFSKVKEVNKYVVCDGSGAKSSLSGGIKVLMLRALAHICKGFNVKESFPKVEIKIAKNVFPSLSLKALELSTLKEVSKKVSKASLIIHEGTIYPILNPRLIRDEEGLKAVKELMQAFLELFTIVKDRELVLIGLCKDSNVSYVRTRAILERLLSETEIAKEVIGESFERNAKRMADRLKKVKEKLSGNLIQTVEYYINELLTLTSDEEVFDCICDEAGFSIPLVLAPNVLFFSEEIKAGNMYWKDTAIRRRLHARKEWRELGKIMDLIYELPPVAISYWRPWHRLGVYRVDIFCNYFDLEERWSELSKDGFLLEEGYVSKAKELVSMLNYLSPEPFVIKPLMDIDELVRIKRAVYERTYEVLIKDKLKKLGYRALPAKRTLRDILLRRI